MINLDPSDRDLLIRTVIGEAQSEPEEGKKAVAHVIVNRMAKDGAGVQDVIFKERQFEPWDTRRDELLRVPTTSDAYKSAAAAVDRVLGGEEDVTGGATHFLNEDIVRERRGGSLPEWAKGKGQPIGRHTFYAPEGRVSRMDGGALRVTITPKETQIAGPMETAGDLPFQEESDPDILAQLGLMPSQAALPAELARDAPEETAPGVEEVTDPEVLKQLGVGGEQPPALSQSVAPNAPIEKGSDAGLNAAYVSGFASDENETLRYLAQQLYPNEPIEQAVKRFGSRDGVLYHKGDDGKLYEALPGSGWGLRDIAGWLASGAGKSIPMLTGGTAGVVTAPLAMTGPVGLAGTMLAAGGAGAAGEALRQKWGDYMMGDASTGDLALGDVATEGAMNMLGQGIGAGIGHMATRNAVSDIAKLNPTATTQAYDEAARAGINITPAEATGLPSLAWDQKRLTNIAPTMDTMRDFFQRRDGQVVKAWNGFLDNLSTAADAEEVGRLGREAAEGAIADARRTAQLAAKPLYDAAFQKRVPMTPELADLLKRPAMKKAAAQAKMLAENEGEKFDLTDPDMKALHYIKRGLDEVLGSAEVVNAKTGGFNDLGRVVQGIKREFLDIVDEAVPEYAQARAVYADGIEDAENAMASALGTIAKMKDTSVLDAARHVFNPRTRSPQMVLTLRRALEKQNPAAWQSLKRMFVQDVTLDALRIAEQGDVLNPAGKLHKAFLNPRLRENLRAAMTDDEFKAMNDLLVVFKRAASVPALRSDTEFNRLMTEEAADRARPLLAKIVRNANPAQAIKSASEWMTDRSLEKKAKQAAALITSGDPKAITAMKELKRLSPLDRRFLSVFGQMVSHGGYFGLGQLVPEADYAPGQ